MRIQTPFEEKLNTLSHAITAILGVLGLALLIFKNTNKTNWSLFSVIIYGASIIVLFSASAFYHYEKRESRKHYFRILDHISIYVLIAGTYTPVVLITLSHSLGWPLFYAVWGIALFGVFLKLFFTGRFEIFSTLLYLIMGWLIVFDYNTLAQLMPTNGLLLLAAGGAAYTFGILFYSVDKIPYNHVIWHFFVIGGALFHYLMIYFYVI